jgi:hypothetical protein
MAKERNALRGVLLCALLLFSRPVEAAGAVDGRAETLAELGRCLVAPACTSDRLFVGPAVASELTGLRQELGGKITRPVLLAKAPATLLQRWQLHMDQAKAELQKRGLDVVRLRKLGDPLAVVEGSATVAVALLQAYVSKSGSPRPHQFFAVLWEVEGQWRVAFLHRMPFRVARFLRTQRPVKPPTRQ